MKFPVCAEQLKHIITFRRLKKDENGEPLKDAEGFPAGGWEDVPDNINIHAFVDPTSGSEYFAAQKVNPEANGNVWIRYRSGITSEMRIAYGTRILDIAAPPIDLYEAHRWIRLIYKELI